ncbi:MAG: hypothetical protein ABEN55_09865 [Bradymonadaceae bacterium]
MVPPRVRADRPRRSGSLPLAVYLPEDGAGHQLQIPNNMFFQKIIHVEAGDGPTAPLDSTLEDTSGEQDATMSGV